MVKARHDAPSLGKLRCCPEKQGRKRGEIPQSDILGQKRGAARDSGVRKVSLVFSAPLVLCKEGRRGKGSSSPPILTAHPWRATHPLTKQGTTSSGCIRLSQEEQTPWWIGPSPSRREGEGVCLPCQPVPPVALLPETLRDPEPASISAFIPMNLAGFWHLCPSVGLPNCPQHQPWQSWASVVLGRPPTFLGPSWQKQQHSVMLAAQLQPNGQHLPPCPTRCRARGALASHTTTRAARALSACTGTETWLVVMV